MSELRIQYDPPPTVERFLASDAFVRCIVGPIGSGKSSGCVMEILRRAVEQEPGPDGKRRTRFAVIRNTYPELRDTTRKTFEQWIPDAIGEWHEQEFTFRMSFNDVECEVLFRALDRPDHVKKLLSLELTGAYLNEAKEIARGVFDMLQGRVGRYPSKLQGGASWFGIWMDTNPCDTDHWIYKLLEEARPEGFELFRQPSGLSPHAENLANLPPGYYERLTAGKDADWINVYLRGQYGFVKDGKPVFPEYNDAIHCVKVAPLSKAEVGFGSDFGLTPAAVLAQRDPSDGQVQIFRELVAQDLGAVSFGRELSRILKTECPGRSALGWGDPAGMQRSQVDERTPFDVLAAQGLPIGPAPTNDVMLRLEGVKGLLSRLTIRGRPALVIDPCCTVLRKALGGGYCFQRVKVSGAERYRDTPAKNEFSHVADALQYLAVGWGEDRRAVYGATHRKVAVNIKVKRAFGSRR